MYAFSLGVGRASRASVHLRGVSYAHSVAVEILRDVDLDLGPGWFGVVGANGAGKTTLLRLIAGDLVPDRGTVSVVADVAPAWCRQDLDAPTEPIQQFASSWDGVDQRLRGRLGLGDGELERWSSLSPGERTRWQIGAALGSRTDVLLLDEPTNHLDERGRRLLIDALQRFEGVALLVSHDRALLDALTTTTLRLVDGAVQSWAGGYSKARAEWRAADERLRTEHDRSRRAQARHRREVARRQEARAGADRGAAATRRAADLRDHDAKSMGAKFLAEKAEARHGRAAAVARRRLEREQESAAAMGVTRQHGGAVTFAGRTSSRDVVAELSATTLYAGSHPVLCDIDVVVRPHDRIHLRGPNGAGKSTLLDALVATSPLTSDQIAVLPQEQDDAQLRRSVAWVRGLGAGPRGRILGIAANLGADPDRLLRTDLPSPGEGRKLLLASLLDREPSLLALDEPTNHLDLPAIERLEEALADGAGALVLITHDDGLAAAVTNSTWFVEDGSVRVGTGSDPDA